MATSLPTRHPGNLAVRHFRGASRTVRHGETVNPPAIERAGPETPHLQRGALDLYPNRLLPRHPPTRAESGNAETAKPFPKVARAVPQSRAGLLAIASTGASMSPSMRT